MGRSKRAMEEEEEERDEQTRPLVNPSFRGRAAGQVSARAEK
jgi:hypothetical protein